MAQIALLDQETIDKIAAGEVIERPSSIVKELVENSIDAKASAVTVEIKEGGISFIRVTDNGGGIAKEDVKLAFLRHSTSKIKSVEDLLSVSSLGFRGEALSSIAAVSQVELITKTVADLTGCRYQIEGSKEIKLEEIGAPDGTTFLVRNLFYNTPARKKFLKSPQTEAGYIASLVERLALSHPEISFQYIANNQTKLHTSGNSNARDVIYQIYGSKITAELLTIDKKTEFFTVEGFLGKPRISRGNRNYENYFINSRYIKSSLLAKAIEDAYQPFLMQHQYPFCVLYFTFPGELLDVNVHPTKMELRFTQNEGIYKLLCEAVNDTLARRDFIAQVPVAEEKEESRLHKKELEKERFPEPFEKKRLEAVIKSVAKDSPYEKKYAQNPSPVQTQLPMEQKTDQTMKPAASKQAYFCKKDEKTDYVQEEIPHSEHFLSPEARKKHRIIGQAFDTYWIVEYEEKLFIIDQHAAHEKVLFEETMCALEKKEFTSQRMSPPVIVSLDASEEKALSEYMPQLQLLGFEIEPFGGKEYSICAVPGNLYGLDARQILMEILSEPFYAGSRKAPRAVLEKIASMSCKAAVKGNQKLSLSEIDALIEELLKLENPYFCPHGRPTIIAMSKYELEKKFKRIV